MVKKFKQFNESHIGINSICEKYGITNYRINDDGSIDVNGDNNKLIEGCTKSFVGKGFSFRNNQLIKRK